MKDDVDRIMEVMNTAFDPAFGEAWSRRQVEDVLALPGYAYRLITASGEHPASDENAVGFSLSRSILGEEELLLFAIAPDCRLRGLGARLLGAFARDAAQRGAGRLFLEMRRGNPAERLYRNFGFLPVGERLNYYAGAGGRRIDAITFAANIDSQGNAVGCTRPGE